MKTPLLAALTATMVLTSCGTLRESRLNPFNWFGRAKNEPVNAAEIATLDKRDPRPLVEQVVSMRVQQVPGGALVTAIGLPPTQGHWAAELVPDDLDERPVDGVLSYSFRLVPPPTPQPASTRQSRTVTVGHRITDQSLAGTRRIVIRGANNQQVARR